jgi:hypothetical protein
MVLSNELMVRAIVIGVIATAIFDGWALLLWRLWGIRPPVWSRLGRLILHGRDAMHGHGGPFSKAEQVVGSAAHYATGIGFALALLGVAGLQWGREPSIGPALIAGVLTLLPAWLIMLPALGQGIAGQGLPHPARFRIVSAASHLVLGGGFYIGALLSSVF